MFSRIREDIRRVFDRDPAARTVWEVLTCYPGFHAVTLHRLAHAFWNLEQFEQTMMLSLKFFRAELVTSPGRTTAAGK